MVLNPSVRRVVQAARPANLALMALYYGVLYIKFFSDVPLPSYVLLMLTVLFLAAAGNLHNDLEDIPNDIINRKANLYVRERTKFIRLLPYWLYAAGLASGGAFALISGEPGRFFYFVAVAALLFFYNKALKKTPLIGNFTVSLLTALAVVQPLFFFPADHRKARFLFWLAMVMFLANLAREIVKDILDRKGDRLAGFRTLGVLSVHTAARTLFFVHLFLIAAVLMLATAAPGTFCRLWYAALAVFFAYLLRPLTAKRKSYAQLKNYYKWSMLAGILGLTGC
ncbi:MAG: UbiA family prenyltransferase [Chlorobi bacterium]|nr:UbiA family prenyltransferase [Chlorobiota bacterium]